MNLTFKVITLFLFCVHFVYADPGNRQVMRVGGMELSPFGYGVMQTQPHQSLDSTNTEFANYYAQISLWLGGVTSSGDTIVTCPRLNGTGQTAGFVTKRLYRDTTNVLQLSNVEFTTVSVYQDTANGWRVKQFNIALQDYSAGIIAYLVRYSGRRGDLANVYAGVHFDFDVPNTDNHPTPDDDWLDNRPSGYKIGDFQANHGLNVEAAFSPLLRNFWRRSELAETAEAVYQVMSQNGLNSPQDTADYHFYLGSGPYTLSAGQGIILVYTLEPDGEGLSKSTSELGADLEKGIAAFSQDKFLVSANETPLNKEPLASAIPHSYRLFQNYPNPFNPVTRIRFQLPEAGVVQLEVFNTLGQRVRTLLNKSLEAGSYAIDWNATNQQGQVASSGIYIYRLTAPNYQMQKKMLLIR